MATTAPPPARSGAAARVQAIGGPARFEHVAEEVPRPRRTESGLLFLLSSCIFFWLGYLIVVQDSVVVFDALDRVTRAYMVWHNDEPKLAAIGFVFPPLTTIAFLPFTLVKPLATSLVALPLVSSLFGGAMLVALNRVLARCSLPGPQRWTLLALIAVNPLVVFYAGNGMSEMLYLALLALSLYCFMSWLQTAQPRYLIAGGLLFALLVLLRYSFGIWALLVAVLIAIGLRRRGAANDETEGTLVTFLAPLGYALAVWILFNWLIVGDPFTWVSGNGASAVNATPAATSGFGPGEVLVRLGELAVGVFGLGIVVLPALVVVAITRRDEMAWWLVALALVSLALIGTGALVEQDPNALAMRNALPLLLLSVAGAGWLYRVLPNARLAIWVGTAVGLVLTAAGSWLTMQRYPFQGQEQAFVRAIQTGEDQDGTNAIGGFRVGTRPEEQMAAYVNANVRGRSSTLTDNAQTFGVILLSGRPETFFDRVDRGDGAFEQTARRPYGRVSHMLVAKNASGDLIRRRYPTQASRTAAGLTPVFETERYLLLAVPARPTGSAPEAGGGGGRVGGPASGAGPAPSAGGGP